MAKVWKKKNERSKIVGFWNREGTLQGIVDTRVETDDNAFYVIKATESCKAVTSEGQTVEVYPGDKIGIGESSQLSVLSECIYKEVRIEFKGKTVSKKGREVNLFDVEVFEEENVDALINQSPR